MYYWVAASLDQSISVVWHLKRSFMCFLLNILFFPTCSKGTIQAGVIDYDNCKPADESGYLKYSVSLSLECYITKNKSNPIIDVLIAKKHIKQQTTGICWYIKVTQYEKYQEDTRVLWHCKVPLEYYIIEYYLLQKHRKHLKKHYFPTKRPCHVFVWYVCLFVGKMSHWNVIHHLTIGDFDDDPYFGFSLGSDD